MAIVEMRKMRLLAMRKDAPKILRRLQRLSCVEIIPNDQDDFKDYAFGPTGRQEALQKDIARLDWAVGKVAPFDPQKKGMFALKPVLGEDDVTLAAAAKGETMGVVDDLERIEQQLGALRSREAKARAQIAQVEPWLALDAPIGMIGGTKHALTQMLLVPEKQWQAFLEGAKKMGVEPCVQEISRDKDNVYAFCAVHARDFKAWDELTKACGASPAQLPEAQGTPAEIVKRLGDELTDVERERTRLSEAVAAYGEKTVQIKRLRDVTEMELKRAEAEAKFVGTRSAFLLTAWTPAAKEEAVKAAVSKVTGDYDISFEAPLDDEKPPTALQNNSFVRPFESIVKMYSLPDPRGIDPTAIMLPFFICYFGLMVSDAAYGVILAIAAGLLAKKLRCKGGIGSIAAVACLGGVATIVWGALLGGWFGIEDAPALLGFTPMSEPLKMMVMCLALGAVQILTGMFVAMYMAIKRGKPLDALFDQGFWLIIFAGIGFLFVNSTVGAVLMIAGAAGIILTGGRQKKGLGRIISGLGKLYDITSYLSDILSYARLFGMGLATGVIALVFNNVAMMVWGGVGSIFSILILIVGHAFNLGINALGAYVHACRLQYIEFFGKFYEDGGVAFMPLNNTGKYVDFETDEDTKAA